MAFLVAVGFAASGIALNPAPAAAEDKSFTIGRRLSLAGMAADPGQNLYWAIADPTSPRILAIDPTGKELDPVTITDWNLTSLQALARDKDALYVGDIGDPGTRRERIEVLRIEAPKPGMSVAPRVIQLTYPDGAHDAAAMMMSPKGHLHVITRGPKPGIYRAEVELKRGEPNMLKRVSNAPVGVSDATFLPGRAAFALWADSGLYLCDAYDFSVDAIGPIPRTGQALAVGLEGSMLMLGTGGKEAKVVATPQPTGKQTVAPSASPKPTPKPSATPTTVEDLVTEGPQHRRTGTFIAIGMAALLAVGAGALTLLRSRPWMD